MNLSTKLTQWNIDKLEMQSPEACNDGHREIIFDSRYGDFSCPVCLCISHIACHEPGFADSQNSVIEKLKL